MRKRSNNEELKNNYNEKFIYFIQLWGELLDPRTIDIYQHNLLNVFLALKELLHVTEKTLAGVYISSYNFEDCKAEVQELLSADDIIEQINPHIFNCLKNKLYGKLESKESKIGLVAQLKNSIRRLEDSYLETLFVELKNNLINDDYEKINKHTKALVSQCIDIGWSPKGLLEAVRFLKNEEDTEDINIIWENFKSKLINISHMQFDVYIEFTPKTISAEKKRLVINELNSMGVEIFLKQDIQNKYLDLELDTMIKTDRTYISREICAADIYSAAQKALQSITNKIYLLSFYGYINFWDIGNATIFVINPVTKYVKSFQAEELFKPYEYIDITNRVFESTKDIFSGDNSNIIEKLSGAFAYTNIAKASVFQEARFMNLWVALESLVRTDLYKDIITNVKEIIPSACVKRYLFSVIRNFIEDCTRCDVILTFSNGKSINLDNKQEAVEEMIEIIKDDVIYTELITKTEMNQLLYYRCKEIYDMIHDFKILRQKLENHYKMIKWNLQRLYRIRNDIAHSAAQLNVPITQIKHLFSYLTTIILEIVAVYRVGGFETVEEVYCKIVNDYEAVIQLLSNTRRNNAIDTTLLKDGFVNLV